MSVVIKSTDGKVLYTSEKPTVHEALEDAVSAGSDLRGSNLSYSDLRCSDLRCSDLRCSDLRYSDLRGSDLSCSNLSGSNLSYSNLSYSDTCLSVTGMPSGHAILAPLPEGWRLAIGCWSGTVTELRELIGRDDDWPEATGEQIVVRRPILTALADMCDAWTAAKHDVLKEIQTKWATTEVSR